MKSSWPFILTQVISQKCAGNLAFKKISLFTKHNVCFYKSYVHDLIPAFNGNIYSVA